MLFDVCPTLFGQRPYDGGRCVELVYLALGHNLPIAVKARISRDSFKKNAGKAIDKRPIYAVTMTGYPSDISSTPKSFFGFQIERDFAGQGCKKQITSLRMDHSLWFAGTTACIKDKKRIFGIHWLGFHIIRQ